MRSDPVSAARTRLRRFTAPSGAGTSGVWTDDSAGTRFVRRGLLPVAAAVIIVFLASGVALGRGDPTLYVWLIMITAGQAALYVGLIGLGQRIAAPQQLRLVLATTPATFLLLGMAGWDATTTSYYPVIATMVAGVTGMLVALTQPRWIVLPWAVVSALTLAVGAITLGAQTGATILPTAFLAGIVVLASLFRDGIERHHSDRLEVVRDVARLEPTADPEQTAASIVDMLQAWGRFRVVAIAWFTTLGETRLLATASPDATLELAPGDALPAARNAALREKAAVGPWLTDWTLPRGDDQYQARVLATGVHATAYVPIIHEKRPIGLVVAASDRARADGRSELVSRLAALIEVADLAGHRLGPGLERLDARSAVAQRLDRILERDAFHPVFQPVLDLDTGLVVGFEALTRFDEAVSPAEVFTEAGQLGRLRELELATVRAALGGARGLPPDRWLSINVSPMLLCDPAMIRSLLAGVDRPIVLELSEHEEVDDYAVLRAALDGLGTLVSLAVDDAGAGFSSLRHILETSPAWVKLDVGVVRGLDADPARRAMVAGLVHFAHGAGIHLVAEGIETEAELRALRTLGVELGQGFLLGRPGPASAAA
jgi:EAL domain-containing protein (putative c-di-GMP-specific phosphodiesterase class I)